MAKSERLTDGPAHTELFSVPDKLVALLTAIEEDPLATYANQIQDFPWSHAAQALASPDYLITPRDDNSPNGIDTRIGQMQHVYQVGVTARALAMHIPQEEVDIFELRREVDLLAATHDEGRRIVVNGKHAEYGQQILRAYGAPGYIVDFAIEHDGMGVGTFTSETSIIEGVMEACGDPSPMNEIVEERFNRLGLAKSLVIIADLSKAYLDSNDPHFSSIAAVDRDVLHAQIKRKTQTVGGYEMGSDKCRREMAAAEFLLGLIACVADKYDLNYSRAIESAANTWQQHGFDEEITKFVKGEVGLEDSRVIQMVYAPIDSTMSVGDFLFWERRGDDTRDFPAIGEEHRYLDRYPGEVDPRIDM